MSDTMTRQCVECAREFDVGELRGRPPIRCPACRKDAGERTEPSANGRKKPRTKQLALVSGSPAIASAIEALREEIESLTQQVTVRQEALDALEAIA